MKGELTAVIEKAPEGGYWAICPEIPGANGQGETIEETKKNLQEAIKLILDDRKNSPFQDLFGISTASKGASLEDMERAVLQRAKENYSAPK